MIVVDARSVPDFPSGVRTRLRGLYGAYAQLDGAPPVTVLQASKSRLFEGVPRGSLELQEVASLGGPVRRAIRSLGHGRGRRFGAEVWHSETVPSLGPRDVPQLLTLHDLRHRRGRSFGNAGPVGTVLRTWASHGWLPRITRRLAALVTVSEASRQDMIESLGLAPEQVVVIPNATCGMTGTDSPHAGSLMDFSMPYVLAIGHLEARKGLDLVLHAVSHLPATLRLSVVFAGEGPQRKKLEALADRVGLHDRTWFLGRVHDGDLPALFRGAVALLFPSHWEGFGLPVYEALSFGCPVLATNLQCFEPLPKPGVLTLERDVAAWTTALTEVATNLDHWKREARSSAEGLANGTWERSAVQLAELYRSLLDSRASAKTL